VSHAPLIATLLVLAWSAHPLHGQQVIEGIPSTGYSEALKKADAVAVLFIDAAQRQVLQGKVTAAVKGVNVGAELCVGFSAPTIPMPAVASEALFFLFHTSALPRGDRIFVCEATASFYSVPEGAPGPLPVAYTWELRPCATQPCTRGLFCPEPPCFRMAKTVRLFASAFPEIHGIFPAACPDYVGNSWVLLDDIVAAMHRRLAAH
jgi:hypothetical protein